MIDIFALSGQVILVAGGTRGIGRAITLQCARAGAKVIALYVRNQEAAEELSAFAAAEQLNVDVLRADLTMEKSHAAIRESLFEKQLTGFVCCAATGIHKPFAELTTRHFDFTFALNVRAFFSMVQFVLPLMSKGGSIVALSSEGAVHAYPTYSLVGASKGAIESLCRHLAVELAEQRVRVNILSPGSVLTDAWDAFPDKEQRLQQALARSPMKQLTTPEEVAFAAQFLLCEASKGINGHTLVVDGGQRIRG
jgi:NAD(P)-dependent dehydrogenase (short-subunit alcohol dehydrogenase family)